MYKKIFYFLIIFLAQNIYCAEIDKTISDIPVFKTTLPTTLFSNPIYNPHKSYCSRKSNDQDLWIEIIVYINIVSSWNLKMSLNHFRNSDNSFKKAGEIIIYDQGCPHTHHGQDCFCSKIKLILSEDFGTMLPICYKTFIESEKESKCVIL